VGAQILIVEDDTGVCRSLVALLRLAGFEVQTAGNVATAVQLVRETQFDLLVLDWNLPDGSGLALLRAVRGRGQTCPAIMLTGRSEIDDRVTALDSGADDYLVKPFDPKELVARVQAHLRRAHGDFGIHKIGRITLCESEGKVLVDGQEISLKKQEFEFLRWLARLPGRQGSREDAIRTLWHKRVNPHSSHLLDVYVANIRRTLGVAAGQLATVWGQGFRLVDGDGGQE